MACDEGVDELHHLVNFVREVEITLLASHAQVIIDGPTHHSNLLPLLLRTEHNRHDNRHPQAEFKDEPADADEGQCGERRVDESTHNQGETG